MAAPAKLSSRPYLAAAQRREHLLDVAAHLVRHGGWTALSMQGLAAAAAVSRQLVYEYFDSADDLYLATLTHLFERAYDATAAIIGGGGSLPATIGAAYELYLDLPAEERRALRALASDVDRPRSPSGHAKRRLRTRIAGLWIPYVRQQTDLPEAEAAALAWMLITAGWGLADSLTDGSLGRKRAVDLFVRFAVNALATAQLHADDATNHRLSQSRARTGKGGKDT
jgi:AcrR family transcriptional regulator